MKTMHGAKQQLLMLILAAALSADMGTPKEGSVTIEEISAEQAKELSREITGVQQPLATPVPDKARGTKKDAENDPSSGSPAPISSTTDEAENSVNSGKGTVDNKGDKSAPKRPLNRSYDSR